MAGHRSSVHPGGTLLQLGLDCEILIAVRFPRHAQLPETQLELMGA